MEVEIQLKERVKELATKKKKLISTMKRAKRAIVKARVEKAKVDGELKKIKVRTDALAKMTPDEARAHVLKEMDSVTPEAIYPKDLEREFERIDKPRGNGPVNEREVLDLAPDADDDADAGDDAVAVPHHRGDDDGRVVDQAVLVGSSEEEFNAENDEEGDEVIDLSNE